LSWVSGYAVRSHTIRHPKDQLDRVFLFLFDHSRQLYPKGRKNQIFQTPSKETEKIYGENHRRPFMLSKELLDILCCPKCKGDLDYDAENNKLTCKKCGKVYEVKDDIPIMLVDDEEQAS